MKLDALIDTAEVLAKKVAKCRRHKKNAYVKSI